MATPHVPLSAAAIQAFIESGQKLGSFTLKLPIEALIPTSTAPVPKIATTVTGRFTKLEVDWEALEELEKLFPHQLMNREAIEREVRAVHAREEKAIFDVIASTCVTNGQPPPSKQALLEALEAAVRHPVPRPAVFLVSSLIGTPSDNRAFILPRQLLAGLPCDEAMLCGVAAAREVHRNLPLRLVRRLSPTSAEYRFANLFEGAPITLELPPFDVVDEEQGNPAK